MSERRRRFEAKTESLAALGDFLRESCGEEPQSMLIELAVTEVVVNAIKHGGASYYEVTVHPGDDGCWLEVKDDGQPFDLTQVEPRPMGELREGGYGLGILKAAAAELNYAWRDGHNLLTIHFAKGDS